MKNNKIIITIPLGTTYLQVLQSSLGVLLDNNYRAQEEAELVEMIKLL